MGQKKFVTTADGKIKIRTRDPTGGNLRTMAFQRDEGRTSATSFAIHDTVKLGPDGNPAREGHQRRRHLADGQRVRVHSAEDLWVRGIGEAKERRTKDIDAMSISAGRRRPLIYWSSEQGTTPEARGRQERHPCTKRSSACGDQSV